MRALKFVSTFLVTTGLATLALEPAPAETETDAVGQWFLDPESGTEKYEFSLRISVKKGHESWSSRDVTLSELEGLTEEQLKGRSVPVAFQVKRDAGTVLARGSVTRGKGAGTFELTLDPAFATELQRRGVGRPTQVQHLELLVGDVSLKFLDELRALRYPTPDVALLIRCVHHGVDQQFVSGLNSLGYRLDSIEQLIKARDHGVDPRFIRGMQDAGYRDLEFEQLLRARDHGADPEYVAWMRRRGFTPLSLEELIRARDHGVDPDYVQGMESAGYRRLPLEQLVKARDHGVDGDFVASMQDVGYPNLTLEQAIRARDHGVDARFAERVQRRLREKPTLEELIRIRDQGGWPD